MRVTYTAITNPNSLLRPNTLSYMGCYRPFFYHFHIPVHLLKATKPNYIDITSVKLMDVDAPQSPPPPLPRRSPSSIPPSTSIPLLFSSPFSPFDFFNINSLLLQSAPLPPNFGQTSFPSKPSIEPLDPAYLHDQLLSFTTIPTTCLSRKSPHLTAPKDSWPEP